MPPGEMCGSISVLIHLVSYDLTERKTTSYWFPVEVTSPICRAVGFATNCIIYLPAVLAVSTTRSVHVNLGDDTKRSVGGRLPCAIIDKNHRILTKLLRMIQIEVIFRQLLMILGFLTL